MAEDIEFTEGKEFLEARFLRTLSLEHHKGQILASVQAARERKLTRLLVDLREMSGYTPSTTDRFEIGNFGAEVSGGFRVAVVLTTLQARDPFPVLVARNRGLEIEAFGDREEALEWLLRIRKPKA